MQLAYTAKTCVCMCVCCVCACLRACMCVSASVSVSVCDDLKGSAMPVTLYTYDEPTVASRGGALPDDISVPSHVSHSCLCDVCVYVCACACARLCVCVRARAHASVISCATTA